MYRNMVQSNLIDDNQPATLAPDQNGFKCFHHLFEEVAKKYPNRKAVTDEYNNELSYEQLNLKANQVANFLLKVYSKPEHEKPQPGTLWVGVFAKPSIDWLIMVMAIFKAGLVYVPFDLTQKPKWLLDKLKYKKEWSLIADDLGSKVIQSLNLENFQIDCIDFTDIEVLYHVSRRKCENLNLPINAETLSYVISSSGSTGEPKTMLLPYRGLPYFAESCVRVFNVTPDSVIAQHAAVSFDACLQEVVTALAGGASLCIVPREYVVSSESNLVNYFNKHNITVATFVPTFLRKFNREDFKTLKCIVTTGETANQELLDEWSRRDGRNNLGMLVCNGYGPTECSIGVTLGVHYPGRCVSIGQSIDGTQLIILPIDASFLDGDSVLEEVPDGHEGELYIAGNSLGIGYTNQHLTDKNFVTFNLKKNEEKIKIRAFKSNDLVHREGRFYFHHGRLDDCVKIKGKFVSLTDVEAKANTALRELKISNVKIFAIDDDSSDDTKILGVIVGDKLDRQQCYQLSSIIQKTDDRFVPYEYVLFDEELPVTHNNKLNRKVLKECILNKKLKIKTDNDLILQENIINDGAIRNHELYKNDSNLQAVVDIWLESLSLEKDYFQKIKPEDNFINFGGDSLKVLNLLNRLNTKFYVSITSSEFFLDPTPRGLLRLIFQYQQKKQRISLIEVQSNGVEPPVFLVHAIEGDPHADYDALITAWDKFCLNRPLYLLKALELQKPGYGHLNLDSMASAYMHEILSQKNFKEPYLICGWSSGGVIAYKMVQKLTQGRLRASVIMIDSESPCLLQKAYNFFDYSEKAIFLIDYFSKVFRVSVSWRERYENIRYELNNCSNKAELILFLFGELRNLLSDQKSLLRLSLAENIALSTVRDDFTYHGISPDQIALIVTEDTIEKQPEKCKFREHLGWPALFHENVASINGDHFGIMQQDSSEKPQVFDALMYYLEILNKSLYSVQNNQDNDRRIDRETNSMITNLFDRKVRLGTAVSSQQASKFNSHKNLRS